MTFFRIRAAENYPYFFRFFFYMANNFSSFRQQRPIFIFSFVLQLIHLRRVCALKKIHVKAKHQQKDNKQALRRAARRREAFAMIRKFFFLAEANRIVIKLVVFACAVMVSNRCGRRDDDVVGGVAMRYLSWEILRALENFKRRTRANAVEGFINSNKKKDAIRFIKLMFKLNRIYTGF